MARKRLRVCPPVVAPRRPVPDPTTEGTRERGTGLGDQRTPDPSWTRLYIVSAVAGLPDQSATANRLFQNQVDIGDAVKPFYGYAAGNQLTSLLHDHIALAAQLLADAKAGDSSAVAADESAWYDNANRIADFLSAANPKNWADGQMRSMMKTHLDLTLQEAVDRLHGDYPADIADYEKVHLEILSMADMLSSGIIAQCPQMFAPGS